MGSARVEPSIRRTASLGNDGTSAVRAVPRLDLHPAVAGEERSERIPRAMRPSQCGNRAITLLAVHGTAHLRGHRASVPRESRDYAGGRIPTCDTRIMIERQARQGG